MLIWRQKITATLNGQIDDQKAVASRLLLEKNKNGKKKRINLKAGACALASTLKIIDLGKDLANDLFSRTIRILSNGYGNMI